MAAAERQEFLAPAQLPADDPALRTGGEREAAAPPAARGGRLAFLLMLGALAGKAVGFVREIVMAHMFGVAHVADAYRAANTGVFLPFVPLQNESVPGVMVPLYRDWAGPAQARRFAALVVGVGLFCCAVAALLLLSGDLWIDLIVGGFSAQARETTRGFVAIMAFGMPASVLINVFCAAEIARGRSRLNSLRAGAVNLAVLGGLGVYALTGNLAGLPLGFTAGFNLLAAYGALRLAREGAMDFRGLRPALVAEVMVEFWRRLKPFLAIPFAEQGCMWIERLLASRLVAGTLASLDYARTLTETALLFIAQPLGLAVLADGRKDHSREHIGEMARALFVVMIPACVGLAIFGPDFARVLFARGAFNETAVELTSAALRGFSFGLWAMVLGLVLMRMLNSQGRNGVATIILLGAYSCNMLVNLALGLLAPDLGPMALALGETSRSLALLAGCALALGALGEVGRAGAAAAPFALLAAGGCLIVDQEFANSWLRLALAGVVCGAAAAAGLSVLRPDLRRIAVGALRRAGGRFRPRGRAAGEGREGGA